MPRSGGRSQSQLNNEFRSPQHSSLSLSLFLFLSLSLSLSLSLFGAPSLSPAQMQIV